MSWSINAVGRPEAVRQELARQFESAKQSTRAILHENRSVAIVESLVNNELEALKTSDWVKVVRVTACGSASTQEGRVLSSQISLTLEPIHGFVE